MTDQKIKDQIGYAQLWAEIEMPKLLNQNRGEIQK
jgi:hypothetical protein